MQIYNILKHHGPLTIDIDGELWVVDTGSPFTCGSSTSVDFGGVPHPVNHEHWPEIYTSLRDGFDIKCAGLIGNDILSGLDMVIDLPGHTLTVSTEELECAGTSVPLDLESVGPVIDADFDDFTHRVIFDTGAHISYVRPDLFPSNVNPTRMTDHYPGLGAFETDVINILVGIAGRLFPVNCGTLPSPLDKVFDMADVGAIVGLDLCHFAPTVGYFPRRNLMVL
jgi:hypothetical protein